MRSVLNMYDPFMLAVISRLRSSFTLRLPSGVEPENPSTFQRYGRKETASSEVKSMPKAPERRKLSIGVYSAFTVPVKCCEFTKLSWYMFSRSVAKAGWP